MSDWKFLNSHRVTKGPYASTDLDGFNGAFRFMWKSYMVKVISSDGNGWQHVSVSLADLPKMTPSWELMRSVKDLFWEPEDAVIQIHPPRSDYINNHPGCLHLWRCITPGVTQPLPPSIMVGVK